MPTGATGGETDGSGAVLEAPALVAGLDDVAVMGEAIEQGRGHLGIAEDGRPFAEVEVGGDDDRGLLVEPARLLFIMSSSIPVPSNVMSN